MVADISSPFITTKIGFLTRDPIGYDDGPNSSSYGRSNPTKYVDPLGNLVTFGDIVESGSCVCDSFRRYETNFRCCPIPNAQLFSVLYDKSVSCCEKGVIYSNNRTDSQCCADARAAGLADGDNGQVDGGGVICCNGREVSCSWMMPTTDPQGTTFIDECVRKHEDDHHDSVPCPSTDCLKRNNFHWWIYEHPEECHAYKVEWHCLKSKMRQCSTPQCRIDIGARMSLIMLYAHSNYGGYNVTIAP
jgi:hypothetical protein